VVPFYYQPTLGGSDIESRVTLRGYPDYRFRGNDLALMQIEYTRPIPAIDPVGIYIFYDGGSVALAGQSLGMARYRQDGGLGATLRLQGKIVLRGYAAMGAGNGVHLGYNLEKLF
jgi:hemolysin activation/secretion protein